MLYLNYNEQQEHGTKEFPIAFYHVESNHPRYEMPFHWHKEYEIVLVHKGLFRLMLDNSEITAGPGESIFISSGMIHGGIPDECIYECLVFDPDILSVPSESCRRYLRQIKRQNLLVTPLITGHTPRLMNTINRLFADMAAREKGFELAVTGCLFEIIGLIFREEHYLSNIDNPLPPFKHGKQLKAVFEYIESNYSTPITLRELSQISGMSPKYFCRYFQTIAHRTPMDYLNYYRIEQSCSLLCTTDLPVTAVAYDCGFNDCSYFIKTFKKYKNITPRQYQLQVKSE